MSHQYKPIFINWPIGNDKYAACDLFDNKDLSDYDIAFLDPMEFAISHRLCTHANDLTNAEYIGYSETDFLGYLAEIKKVTGIITSFLDNNGLLVIRSQIPKSYIKIRKQGDSAAQTYTESVVSAFFWLEELIGKYIFKECSTKTISFKIAEHPLATILGRVAVECVQTQDSIGRGKVETIALSGTTPKRPAITRIVPESEKGQIYLIPKFLIPDEHEKLIEAFHLATNYKDTRADKPEWVDFYAKQVEEASKLLLEIDELDKKISKMKNRRDELERRHEDVIKLADLLCETDYMLETAVRIALRELGFECLDQQSAGTCEATEKTRAGHSSRRALFKIAYSERGSIKPEETDLLRLTIEKRDSKVKPKGILIGNAARSLPPERRGGWFEKDCIEMARKNDLCLIPSYELFMAVLFLLNRTDSSNIEDFRSSIRKDIFECDTVFKLDKRKYSMTHMLV